uniref:Uncharacterized protein n=1 Tax=Knipowitschia caucasica TaxID=637954 RepID=A0AAV2KSL9_KNICA
MPQQSTELPPVRVRSTLPSAQTLRAQEAPGSTKATASRDAARKRSDSDLTTATSTPALPRSVGARPVKPHPVTLTTLTTTSLKPALTTTSLKPALTTTSLKPALTTTSLKPALTTTSLKPALTTTSLKPALTTTSVKPALTTTSLKPALTTTSLKPALTTAVLSPPSSVISSKLTQSKTSRRPVTSETLQTSVSEGPDQTKKHSPGPDRTKARTVGRSKFTWVRPVTPKGAAAEPDPDSGPIRRSRVSALSKSRYQWVSRVQKPESVETSPKAPRPGTALKTSPKGPKGSSRFRWAAPQRSVVIAGSSPITMETPFKLRNRTKIIHKTSSSEVRTPSGPKPRTGPRTLVSRHRLRRVSPGSGPKHKELVSVSRHKLRRVRPESRDKGPEGRTSPQSTPRSSLTRSRAKELVSVSRHKLRRIRPESRDQGPESRTSPQSTSRSRTKELVSVSRHKLRRISPGLCRSQSWRSPHTRSPQTRTQTRSRSRTVSDDGGGAILSSPAAVGRAQTHLRSADEAYPSSALLRYNNTTT